MRQWWEYPLVIAVWAVMFYFIQHDAWLGVYVALVYLYGDYIGAKRAEKQERERQVNNYLNKRNR